MCNSSKVLQRLHFKLLLLAFVLLSINANAKVIKVGKDESVKSIKKAIEFAENKDTIVVKSGLYKEGNIIVKKSITFIGENKPIIDGEKKYEIFTLATHRVTITGFTLQNSGKSDIEDFAAIKCLDADSVKLINNTLLNNFFGIHLSNTRFAVINNNRFDVPPKKEYELGNGIHLWKCDSAVIKNNYIKGHRDGMYFEFATDCIIENNTSYLNLRYGLHFMFSHNNHYIHNVFRKNGAGVAVMYTTNVLMQSNIFEDNWGESSYGLLLKDISNSKIIDNVFYKNTIAIYMEGSSKSMFKNNTFKQNGWAIKLMASCDDNSIFENNFIGNTFDIATNGVATLNVISKNFWDKYDGYDLNKDLIGDTPYHPVNLFSSIVENVPSSILLWRSFLVFLLDKSEKVIPVITPPTLYDDKPMMKVYKFKHLK